MALDAVYFLHEDMLCMTVGFAEGDRTLLDISKMASSAGAPRRDTTVLLLGRFVSLDHKGDKHLVLFEDVHSMTYLALKVPVLAHLPGLERFFHHMAG
jgi:hypothetical protein